MNRKFILLIAVCFVFLNAGLSFGQEKAIEKDVFEEITRKANNNLDDKTYRMTNTYEVFVNGNTAPTTTNKTMSETIPPDRYHSIETSSDGKKSEFIRIGEKRYYRENDGKWTTVNPNGGGMGMGCGAKTESESYKFTENIKLNGQTVDLYEKTEKLTDIICDDQSKSEIRTEKHWITKNGLLMKTEYQYDELEKKTVKRDTYVYDYNAKFKIEAPIK